MRAERPVAFLEEQKAWAVFRHEDVRAVLAAHQAFSSEIPLPGGPRPGSMVFVDPPRHTFLRSLVSRAFTPQAVAALEPRIEAIAHTLLDRVAAAGTMETLDDFASPLPVIVIAEMLGVPATDHASFRRWSDAIVKLNNGLVGPGDAGEIAAARAEMNAYFAEIIERRRAAPEQDLVSALVAAEEEGQRLTAQEVSESCRLLLVAGNETTMHLLGNCMLTLLEQPELRERLAREPALIPSFVEEVLRHRSPIQLQFRVVKRDTELRGETLRAGEMVWAFLGSANRDEAVFTDPDRFDLGRDARSHLAFGSGIHFCLGAPLSRLEARVALRVLLARLDAIERADDTPLAPVNAFIVHGVARLPVRFRAR